MKNPQPLGVRVPRNRETAGVLTIRSGGPDDLSVVPDYRLRVIYAQVSKGTLHNKMPLVFLYNLLYNFTVSKKPTSSRPDIGPMHFQMAAILVADLNKKGMNSNWHVVHYLRRLIEIAWVRSGRKLPDGLPHKAYYRDLDFE